MSGDHQKKKKEKRLGCLGKDFDLYQSLFQLSVFVFVQIVITEKEDALYAMRPFPSFVHFF